MSNFMESFIVYFDNEDKGKDSKWFKLKSGVGGQCIPQLTFGLYKDQFCISKKSFGIPEVSLEPSRLVFSTLKPLPINTTKTIYLCATNTDSKALSRKIDYQICGNEVISLNPIFFPAKFP